MPTLENLSSASMPQEITRNDNVILNELQAAQIPFIRLPSTMFHRVKTHYIGVLNGFVFYRGLAEWCCIGDMPLSFARQLHVQLGHHGIFADAKTPDGAPRGYSPKLEQAMSARFKQMRQAGFITAQLLQELKQMEETADPNIYPCFVKEHRIETQEGLTAFAAFIRANEVFVANGEEGSYSAEQFNI